MIKKDINPAAYKKFKYYIEGSKMSAVKSDIEIARAAKMKPIKEILDGINVPDKAEVYSPISRYIAKIKLEYLEKLKTKKIDFGSELDAAKAEAKAWKTIWSAGHGVSSINDNPSVKDLVSKLKKEFNEAIKSQNNFLNFEKNKY